MIGLCMTLEILTKDTQVESVLGVLEKVFLVNQNEKKREETTPPLSLDTVV